MHKGAVFTWVGIVGGAFTVFSNLEDLIGFAKWGAWIAQVWAEAVDATVVKILDSFGLRIENFAGMMVAMAIFVSAIAIGAWLQNRISSEEAWPPHIEHSQLEASWCCCALPGLSSDHRGWDEDLVVKLACFGVPNINDCNMAFPLCHRYRRRVEEMARIFSAFCGCLYGGSELFVWEQPVTPRQ